MKTILSLLLIITLSSLAIAQTTAIPDTNFEQELINQGFDTGLPDGSVLTANINTVSLLTLLNQQSLPISDLTGIEDFTALSYLYCSGHKITSLNLSQNTALSFLYCANNPLVCLNLKNGNNINLYLETHNNPSLSCIEVDDAVYSTSNWTNIDPVSSFNTNCNNSCTVGMDEYVSINISLYPNPTEGNIFIDLGEIKQDIKTTLTNSLGQKILTQRFESTDIFKVDINAPTGIYFLKLVIDNRETKTIKVLKK